MKIDLLHPNPIFGSYESDTPALYITEDRVLTNIQSIRGALDGVEVWYAIKSNPTPLLASFVDKHIDGFEVASLQEVEDLVGLSVPAARMMCMHPIKTPNFIRALRNYGVRILAADSLEEIEKIASVYGESEVALRVSVPGIGSRVPLGEKFGCDPDRAMYLATKARQLGVNIVGITIHVGSQCESIENWRSALSACGEICKRLSSQEALKLISLGGGLPVRYTEEVPSLVAIGTAISKANLQQFLATKGRISIEPGRAIAATAGTMVASVVGKATRSDVEWLYIDAGIYHGLFESLEVAGGITFPIHVEHPDRPIRRYKIAGPTCDSLDAMSGYYELPEVQVGERIAIECTGAYSTSMSTKFNGFRPPRMVLVNSEKKENLSYA